MGGGTAGRAAAIDARDAGREVLVVDEDPLAPDLTGSNVPNWFGGLRALAARTNDPRLDELERLSDRGIEVLAGVRAWAVFPDRVVGLHDDKRSWLVRAGRVVLAAGTADLAVPFRGWRLPGVFGAGAALTLLERSGTLPGIARLAVLGSDELGRRVAERATAAGTRVAALVDLEHSQVDGAVGSDRVQALALTDRRTGETRELPVDGICVAVGLQPAIELAEIAGCEVRPREAGGREVVTDPQGRTSVEGVFVAGPGLPPDARSFAAWLSLIPCPEDEAICACEGVSKADFAAALAVGGSIEAAKRRTRAGMGPCQGRRCMPVAFELAGGRGEIPRSRPPARPIALEILATEEDVPVPSLPAFERAAARIRTDVEAKRVSPFLLARFRRRADELQFQCVASGSSDREIERLADDLEGQIRSGGAVPR